MSQLRWLFAIGLICGSAYFGPADQIIGSANAQGTKPATASEVQAMTRCAVIAANIAKLPELLRQPRPG